MGALFLNLTDTEDRGLDTGRLRGLERSGSAVLLCGVGLRASRAAAPWRHPTAGGQAGPEPSTEEALHFRRCFGA